MYRKHFGLNRHPFAKEIEPDDLFPSAGLRELEDSCAAMLTAGVPTGGAM